MRKWIGGLAAGVLVIVFVAVWVLRDPSSAPVSAAVPPTPTTALAEPPPPPPPSPPPLHQAAAAIGRGVDVSATPGGPVVRTLPNPTVERIPLVFVTLARQAEWIQVRLSIRPNGSTGWIRADQVRIEELAHRIVIERSVKRLRVYQGDSMVLEEPVAVGTPRTPTPLGEFFIDGIVPDPGGVYGAYQLSVAGFSEVLMRFAGGNGQIAIHGTNAPRLIGGEVSNGCVRMRNDSITRVAELAPLGTPVTIVA